VRQRKTAMGKGTGAEIFHVLPQGMGPRSAGQCGDIQGLSGVQSANSESVVELVEEGQDYEAEVVGGVENVPDADAEERLAEEMLGEKEEQESSEELSAEAGGRVAGRPRGRARRSGPSGDGGR
jgi:hypothetical protein